MRKFLKFEAEGREFAKKFDCISKTIHSFSERSDYFLTQNAFLTYSWRFLRTNELEQLQIKLKKIIGIQKYAGKLGNVPCVIEICFFN